MIPFSFQRAINNTECKEGEIIIPWSCNHNEFQAKDDKETEEIIGGKTLPFVNKRLREGKDTRGYYTPVSKHLNSCLVVFTLVTLTTSLTLIVGLLFLTVQNRLSNLRDLFIYSTCTYFILVSIFGLLALIFIKFDTQSLRERQRRFNKVIQELNLTHFFSRGLYWKTGDYGSFLSIRKFKAATYEINQKKLIVSSSSGENLEFAVPKENGIKFSFSDLQKIP